MKFFRFLFWLFIIVILVLIWVNRNALVKFLEQFTHGDDARVERELETRKDVIVENKSVDRSKQDRDTKWLMDRALQAVADKEYDTALSAFRELLDKNPQQVEAWHYLADMLHDMGEHERAAKAYANAAILYNKQGKSDLVQSIIPYVRYYAPDLIPRMGIF